MKQRQRRVHMNSPRYVAAGRNLVLGQQVVRHCACCCQQASGGTCCSWSCLHCSGFHLHVFCMLLLVILRSESCVFSRLLEERNPSMSLLELLQQLTACSGSRIVIQLVPDNLALGMACVHEECLNMVGGSCDEVRSRCIGHVGLLMLLVFFFFVHLALPASAKWHQSPRESTFWTRGAGPAIGALSWPLLCFLKPVCFARPGYCPEHRWTHLGSPGSTRGRRGGSGPFFACE